MLSRALNSSATVASAETAFPSVHRNKVFVSSPKLGATESICPVGSFDEGDLFAEDAGVTTAFSTSPAHSNCMPPNVDDEGEGADEDLFLMEDDHSSSGHQHIEKSESAEIPETISIHRYNSSIIGERDLQGADGFASRCLSAEHFDGVGSLRGQPGANLVHARSLALSISSTPSTPVPIRKSPNSGPQGAVNFAFVPPHEITAGSFADRGLMTGSVVANSMKHKVASSSEASVGCKILELENGVTEEHRVPELARALYYRKP
eukprot:gene15008-21076_t